MSSCLWSPPAGLPETKLLTRRIGSLAAIVLLLAACSAAASRPAGAACSSNGDCGSGLSCLGLAMFSDAGCTSAGMACSKACQSDGDCASLGPGFKCFAGCAGASSCGATL
jgi:hypothetical protein